MAKAWSLFKHMFPSLAMRACVGQPRETEADHIDYLMKGNYMPSCDPTGPDIDDPTGAKIRHVLIFGDSSFTIPYLKEDMNEKIVQYGGGEDPSQHIKTAVAEKFGWDSVLDFTNVSNTCGKGAACMHECKNG